MTILPALREALALPTSAVRGFGRPAALRCRRVSGFSTGGGGGLESGEDAADDEADDPGALRPGVESRSCSGSSSRIGRRVDVAERLERVRFAAPSEHAEEPEDSSKERLGDRCTRRLARVGTAEGGGVVMSELEGCVRIMLYALAGGRGEGGMTSTSMDGEGDGVRESGKGISDGPVAMEDVEMGAVAAEPG